MPPDRTTSSFVESVTSGTALSSHGPGHQPSLERGKACLVCRTRKVKCDGARPTCGSCSKSAIAHGDNPAGIVCNYDEPERGEKRKRGAGGITKVQALEAKIAELEKIITDSKAAGHAVLPASQAQQYQQQPAEAAMAPVASASYQPPAIPQFAVANSFQQPLPTDSSNRNHFDILLQASGQHPSQHNFAPTLGSEPAFFYPDNSMPHFSSNAGFFDNQIPQVGSLPQSPTDAVLLDLLYPGWPKDLPTPSLTTRLIEVYFSKSHMATGMINRRKFLASMTLPPTHSGFPHLALIHGILASASRMVSGDFFLHEEKYWGRNDPAENVTDYHAKRAKAAVDEAIATGQKLFQVAQAVVLLCFYSYTSARFVEVWLGCGLATRIVTPLGLNHLRSSATDALEEKAIYAKPNLLPPTSDEEELHERSVTFWLAFMADRFASASTGWAMSLDETDITTLLPSPGNIYPETDLAASPLSPRNPNFLISHPPHLVEGFQLFMKAVVLLGRVVTFLQRSPTPTAWKVGAPEESEAPVDLRTTRDFKQLDADAVTFRLSIPREYQNIQRYANEDNRLCLVFALPHTATILLHEPFCTMQEADVSMARCLLSARAILEAIYSLWSTSFEIGLLSPYINFCWAVAGRTLVRELAIKQAKNITAGTDQLRADVNTILSAMRSYRSPLGIATANSLQILLDDPSLCLPHKDLRCSNCVLPPEYPPEIGEHLRSGLNGPASSSSSNASPASFDIATPPGGLPSQLGQAGHGNMSTMLFTGAGFSDEARFKEMNAMDFADFESISQFSVGAWGAQ